MNRIIEEETGTYRGKQHPHNGYYAGDFSGQPFNAPDLRIHLTRLEAAA